jgi:hypothetical protein
VALGPQGLSLRTQITTLITCATNCSRQIRGWANSLQNTDIPGQRHLTERSRREYEQKTRASEFQKELLRKLAPGHPLRKAAEERGEI